jgi:hypothetical protein
MFFSVFLAALFAAAAAAGGGDGGGGVDWRTPLSIRPASEVVPKHALSHRPLMLIIHAEDCAPCAALRAVLASPSAEVREWAQRFAIAEVTEDRVRGGELGTRLAAQLPRDVHYLPQVLFADESTTLRPEIINEFRSYQSAKYYYATDLQVREGLKHAWTVIHGAVHEDL